MTVRRLQLNQTAQGILLFHLQCPLFRKSAFSDNNTLNKVTITGSGAIGAFGFAGSGSTGIALVIEDGITSIGNSAFANNQLTEVIIPSALYNYLNDRYSSPFDENPAGLKFYEYEPSKKGNKGRKLN